MIYKHNMLLEEDENTDIIDRLTTLTSTSYFKRKKKKPQKPQLTPIWINHTPLFKSPKPVPWGETFLQRYTEPPGAWGAASGGFRFLQGASDLCLPAVLRRRLRRGAGWTCCWSADSPIHLSSKDGCRGIRQGQLSESEILFPQKTYNGGWRKTRTRYRYRVC